MDILEIVKVVWKDMLATPWGALLGLIILFLVGIAASTNTKKGKIIDVTNGNKKKLNKISIIGLLVSLIGTILIPGSFHQVEAGQVAVVKSLGKVVGTRLPGTYFDFC